MDLQNEYLIIIDEKDSSGLYRLCTSIDRFNELLISYDILKNELDLYECIIKNGKVKNQNQNFFYLTLKFKGEEKDLFLYKELLRKIQKIFHDHKAEIQTFRDDLTFYYARLAYSLIHNIENLMRKLIAYYMITNIGTNWIEKNLPKEVQKALESSKRKDLDVLHRLDFIHLKDFLFQSYSSEDVLKLYKLIEKIDINIDINELKQYLPKSNWDKYFSTIIDCEKDFLEGRWTSLYELRNKIAHNSKFTKDDYEHVERLVAEIKEKVESSFSKIDQRAITSEESTSESMHIDSQQLHFISKYTEEWNKLEIQLRKEAERVYPEYNYNTDYMQIIEKEGLLNSTELEQISILKNFKVNLTMNPSLTPLHEVENFITKICDLNNKILLPKSPAQ